MRRRRDDQPSTVFDLYQPAATWFHGDAQGIHGLSHAARVLVLADAIAETIHTPVDREVLRWSAALHDVGRVDDEVDPRHGMRSAQWVDNVMRSMLRDTGLSHWQVDLITLCCQWHATPDHEIPDMVPAELWILKDADGLDRVRIADLDPDYLRSDTARNLAERATLLELRSRRNTRRSVNGWKRVRKAAQDLGLWK